MPRTPKSESQSIIQGLGKEEQETNQLLVSSGSTLLNCACSDSPRGAFRTGTVVNIIGDKSAGKTMLSLTMLACAANNNLFSDYLLIYDNVERTSQIDIEYLFGKNASDRIIPPARDKEGVPLYSDVITDFWGYVNQLLKKGRKIIYVLDSLDSLASLEDYEYANALSKTIGGDDEEKKIPSGGYKLQSPKTLSGFFRQTKTKLEQTQSLLVIVSQVRENINAGFFEKKYKRSGGRALGHASSHEVWLSVTKTIQNEKLKRVIGHEIKAEVTKSKETGKIRSAKFDIYNDMGIDDISSCVDFLIGEGQFSRSGSIINPIGLYDQTYKGRPSLVKAIEEKGDERKVMRLVGGKWKQIEEQLKLNRKRRFK